jgi:hypothetical protein
MKLAGTIKMKYLGALITALIAALTMPLMFEFQITWIESFNNLWFEVTGVALVAIFEYSGKIRRPR